MTNLVYLVPDALVPSAFFGTDSAPELLRDLSLPHLNFIAAHAIENPSSVTAHASAAVRATTMTPWQNWLLQSDEADAEARPNLAETWAAAFARKPMRGQARWLVEPVALQVGLDRVSLLDPAQLQLSIIDAEDLAEAAAPVLQGDGWQLDMASSQHWLLSREFEQSHDDDQGFALDGVAIERVIGQGIEAWLPHSAELANTRAWKRTVNEIQMIWFQHPVNKKREAAGLPPVNGLWLSGNGRPAQALPRYARVTSGLPLLQAFKGDESEQTWLESFDHLSAPTRAQDWSAWRNALQALDARLGEIVEGMRASQSPQAQQHQTLRLVLCGENGLRDVMLRRTDFWKFWRRGQAIDLLIEG